MTIPPWSANAAANAVDSASVESLFRRKSSAKPPARARLLLLEEVRAGTRAPQPQQPLRGHAQRDPRRSATRAPRRGAVARPRKSHARARGRTRTPRTGTPSPRTALSPRRVASCSDAVSRAARAASMVRNRPRRRRRHRQRRRRVASLRFALFRIRRIRSRQRGRGYRRLGFDGFDEAVGSGFWVLGSRFGFRRLREAREARGSRLGSLGRRRRADDSTARRRRFAVDDAVDVAQSLRLFEISGFRDFERAADASAGTRENRGAPRKGAERRRSASGCFLPGPPPGPTH